MKRIATRSKEISEPERLRREQHEEHQLLSSGQAFPSIQLIRKRALAKLLGVNPWTIDRWRRKSGAFPRPVWLSDSTMAWKLSDIEAWLQTRQASDPRD